MREIGDRMKEFYEDRYRMYLTRRIPVILRIDGVAFHTFTKGFKPFDPLIIQGMVQATLHIMKKMQGAKCAYIQSDEVSILLTDYDKLITNAWFDYNKSKIESVSSALMTAEFQSEAFYPITKKLPYFDCRSFNVPREDVVNYFLWRALDWKRNSLHMFASMFFSQKELFKKNSADKHEMLHKIGKNWSTDLTNQEKNGTFILSGGTGLGYRAFDNILPTYEDIFKNLNELIYCDEISNS